MISPQCILSALAILFLLPVIQALPTRDNPSATKGQAAPMIVPLAPETLLGRHYVLPKREPLIIMDPSLEPPSSSLDPLSEPASKHSPNKAKASPRPKRSFPQYLAERATSNMLLKRDGYDVDYLSNVDAPPPPPPPAPTPPPPPPTQEAVSAFDSDPGHNSSVTPVPRPTPAKHFKAKDTHKKHGEGKVRTKSAGNTAKVKATKHKTG